MVLWVFDREWNRERSKKLFFFFVNLFDLYRVVINKRLLLVYFG